MARWQRQLKLFEQFPLLKATRPLSERKSKQSLAPANFRQILFMENFEHCEQQTLYSISNLYTPLDSI